MKKISLSLIAAIFAMAVVILSSGSAHAYKRYYDERCYRHCERKLEKCYAHAYNDHKRHDCANRYNHCKRQCYRYY